MQHDDSKRRAKTRSALHHSAMILALCLGLIGCDSTSTPASDGGMADAATMPPSDGGSRDASARDGGGPERDGGTIPCSVGSARPASPITIVATAPEGIADTYLGRPVNADFLPIVGADGATLFPEGSTIQQSVERIEHRFVFSDDTRSLAANVSGWSVGSVSAAVEMGRRYSAFEATQVRHVRFVDDGTIMRSAPSAAVYFVSKIFYGHNYSAIIQGSRTEFHAGVRAQLMSFEGSIDAFASSFGLETMFQGRGMMPSTSEAIFARTASDIESSYTTSAEPVPIFVEYQSLGGRCVQNAVPLEWEPSVRAVVSFDRIRVLENGSAPFFDDTWSLNAACRINRRDFPIGETVVWDMRMAICDSDDGMTADGLSYCVYGLDWLQIFDVAIGDRIECDLSGTAHDNDIPLRTGTLEYVVEATPTTQMGTVREGHPDTAQYEFDYTILFE